jgi:hypothetical protein
MGDSHRRWDRALGLSIRICPVKPKIEVAISLQQYEASATPVRLAQTPYAAPQCTIDIIRCDCSQRGRPIDFDDPQMALFPRARLKPQPEDGLCIPPFK